MIEDITKAFDSYDRQLGALKGLPDVIEVKPSTVRVTIPLLGLSQTFIVQTIRQRDVGDHVFLETVSRDGAIRIVLPPEVADTIARQRDALTAKSRSKAAKALAQVRKERGDLPAFLTRKKTTVKNKKAG
jgi:hypothetical protein